MPTGVYKREYNKIYTAERSRKISKALKGRVSPRKGVSLSDETKKKISIALKNNKNGKGKTRTAEQRKRMGEARKGERNYAWKGEEVSYRELHKWVRKCKGKPEVCEYCGEVASEWANIDGQYRRRLEDYISLCKSCHAKKDYKGGRKLSPEHRENLRLSHLGKKVPADVRKKISKTLKRKWQEKS